MLVVEPTPIPPFGEQSQDAETALFVIAFALVLPLALVGVPRLADRIAAGANGPALPALAALLAAAAAGVLVGIRLYGLLAEDEGVGPVLAALVAWSALAALVLARAAAERPWPPLMRIRGIAPAAATAAAVLALAAAAALTTLASIDPVVLLVGAAAIAVVLACRSLGLRPPTLAGRWGTAADLGIAALLLLAIPDLVVFRPEDAALDPATALETGIIQFHQNFLLGPANEVLAGGTVLVDTASQYGVGPIYLLTGWLSLLPGGGYGAFALLDGILTGLLYVAAYTLLRVAGTSRALAATAMAAGVVALVFNLPYSVGALPEQGPLRFGLPLAVVLAAVLGARRPGLARAGSAAALAAVALSSVWALEAFAYTLFTFAAIACFEAWLLPAGGRLRWLLRKCAMAALACLATHLLFTVATLAASGRLPDWGQYLAFLDRFLFGNLGDLTYDFSAWSPGLAVGAAYLASAAAIVLLAGRHRAAAARERVALTALTGTTAYGIALFSYFVDRSGDGILPYVALPVLLVGTLWLGVLLRSEAIGERVRSAGLTLALSLALLALAVAWSAFGTRFPRSALAHAPPGGESLRDAIDRLRHPPPLNPRAPAGEQMLERYFPGEGRVPLLTLPDLGTEILIRSERGNGLPFSDPWEDSFTGDERLPTLRDGVAGLRRGDRLLVDQGALDAFAFLRANPAVDPLSRPTALGALAPLQGWVLQRIGERFELRPVHRDELGFVVTELAPRSPSR